MLFIQDRLRRPLVRIQITASRALVHLLSTILLPPHPILLPDADLYPTWLAVSIWLAGLGIIIDIGTATTRTIYFTRHPRTAYKRHVCVLLIFFRIQWVTLLSHTNRIILYCIIRYGIRDTIMPEARCLSNRSCLLSRCSPSSPCSPYIRYI